MKWYSKAKLVSREEASRLGRRRRTPGPGWAIGLGYPCGCSEYDNDKVDIGEDVITFKIVINVVVYAALGIGAFCFCSSVGEGQNFHGYQETVKPDSARE